MKTLFIRHLNCNLLTRAAWFLVWFSLPVSLKMTNVFLIAAAGFTMFSYLRQPFIPAKRSWLLLLPPLLFFSIHALDLFRGHLTITTWKEIEQMLAFLLLPLVFVISSISKEEIQKASATGFTISLLLCSLWILIKAAIRYAGSGDPEEFVYHQLASPLHSGAVYLSLYLLLSLFMQKENLNVLNYHWYKTPVVFLQLIVFFLLASKILILAGIPLLILFYRKILARNILRHKVLFAGLLLAMMIFLVPVARRISVLPGFDVKMVMARNYGGMGEPDGLELRLILLRFGAEILQEQKAWFTGVGVTMAQPMLNYQIISHNMYTGTMKGNDTGYLNYNFHNQYMETLVRAGLPGLFLLIFMIWLMLRMADKKSLAPPYFIWALSILLITESVLERQAGIIVFCLLYSVSFLPGHDHAPGNQQAVT